MQLEHKWKVLIIVCIGIFMSTLDGSILNIANPVIAHDLDVNMQQIQWIVTLYMLAITASLLLFGHIGDNIGNERIYTCGFMVFTIGSFACSTACNLSFLIGTRIIQALGASMMMATGIGIVSNIFPESERGKALGLTGSIVGAGNMTGPALGGLLIARYNWNIIFLINVPVGLIGFFLALKYLRTRATGIKANRFDIAGAVLLALFTVFMVISLVGSSEINPKLIFIALFFLAGLVWYEKRTVHPLLDLNLLKNHKFTQGNIMGIAAYSSQTFVFFLLPFYMESIMELQSTYSGLLMTIPPVMMIILAPLAGFASDRLGSSRLTTTAFIFMISAYLLLSTLNSAFDPYIISAGLIILGAGMAMFGSPNSSSVLSAVPPEKAGYAGGFLSTVRNLSYCMGTAISVSIFTLLLSRNTETMGYTPAYIGAIHTVYWVGAGIACAGLLISLWKTKH